MAALGLVLILSGVFSVDEKKGVQGLLFLRGNMYYPLIGLISILSFWSWKSRLVYEGFSGMYSSTVQTDFFKILVLLFSVSWLGARQSRLALSFERANLSQKEYMPLVLFSIVGMFFMISANHFGMLFLGLELHTLPLYILVGIRMERARSIEAAMKFFLLGAISSSFFIFGLALIYGFSGELSYEGFMKFMQEMPHNAYGWYGLALGVIFILISFMFKLSAAPFHFWVPDVFEGSSNLQVAFIGGAPKIATLIALSALLFGPFIHFNNIWSDIIYGVSTLSLVVGALGGVLQSNIRRLMAYSSIAQVGYMLMGLVTHSSAGLSAGVFYIIIYVGALTTFFLILCRLHTRGEEVSMIDELRGLGKDYPLIAAVLSISLLSMAGIPPLIGFMGKFYILKEVLSQGYFVLAFVAALSSVISAYYYLRLIKAMYFDESVHDVTVDRSLGVAYILGMLLLLLTFLHERAFIYIESVMALHI